MIQVPIKVDCYPSRTTDEFPVCFYWNMVRFEIKKITDHWYQYDLSSNWSATDYFKICTKNNLYFIMKHEKGSDKWYLVAPENSENLLTFPFERLN